MTPVRYDRHLCNRARCGELNHLRFFALPNHQVLRSLWRHHHHLFFRPVLLDLGGLAVLGEDLHGASLIRVKDLRELLIGEIVEKVHSRTAKQVAATSSQLVRVREYVSLELICFRFVSTHALPYNHNKMISKQMRDK